MENSWSMIGTYVVTIDENNKVSMKVVEGFRNKVLEDMFDSCVHISDLTEDEIVYLSERITLKEAAIHLFEYTNSEEVKTYLRLKFGVSDHHEE